jgi:hypothetical protein
MAEQKDPRAKPGKEPQVAEGKEALVPEEGELSDEELTDVAGGKEDNPTRDGHG